MHVPEAFGLERLGSPQMPRHPVERFAHQGAHREDLEHRRERIRLALAEPDRDQVGRAGEREEPQGGVPRLRDADPHEHHQEVAAVREVVEAAEPGRRAQHDQSERPEPERPGPGPPLPRQEPAHDGDRDRDRPEPGVDPGIEPRHRRQHRLGDAHQPGGEEEQATHATDDTVRDGFQERSFRPGLLFTYRRGSQVAGANEPFSEPRCDHVLVNRGLVHQDASERSPPRVSIEPFGIVRRLHAFEISWRKGEGRRRCRHQRFRVR